MPAKPPRHQHQQQTDDQEVVASGQALRVVRAGGGRQAATARRDDARTPPAPAAPPSAQVASWLGVEDAQAVLEQEGLGVEYEEGRPQGLGLGAAFLPHSKGLALTAGAERRLGAKLLRGAGRAGAGAAAAAEASIDASSGPRPRRAFHSHQQQQQYNQRAPGSKRVAREPAAAAAAATPAGGSSDESEGRGRAFDAKPAACARARGAAFNRAALRARPAGKKQNKRRKG